MNPQIWGKEHIIFFIISVLVIIVSTILIKKYATTQKSISTVLKIIALFLMAAISANRISIVMANHNAFYLIPNSFCGMSSLVLALSVLLGKKDNYVYHFIWFIALFGGLLTVFYPDFISQNPSVFYLPTISGMLHHVLAVFLVTEMLTTGQIYVTYKKWYCIPLGFACYFTIGAFLIIVGKFGDAFNMKTPLLSGTPLNAWVMTPIYAAIQIVIFSAFEIARKIKSKKEA